MSLVFGPEVDQPLAQWVQEACGPGAAFPGSVSFGWEQAGRLTAAISFSHYAGSSIEGSIRIVGKQFPRALLGTALLYAFEQLRVDRITLHVRASNEASHQFVKGLGAQQEAVLEKAFWGEDLIVYKLLPDAPLCQKVMKAQQRRITIS